MTRFRLVALVGTSAVLVASFYAALAGLWLSAFGGLAVWAVALIREARRASS